MPFQRANGTRARGDGAIGIVRACARATEWARVDEVNFQEGGIPAGFFSTAF